MPAVKSDTPPQPWPTGQATERVWRLAKGQFTLVMTKHARKQLLERGLIVGDVLHVLKQGHIYDDAKVSTQAGFYKYSIESSTPNSNSRTLRVIVPSAIE